MRQSAHPRYAVAAHELPMSADPVALERIAVVDGPDWLQAADRADADVVVVAGPGVAPADDLRRLAVPGAPQVVLERGRLRPDLVEDAVAARAGAAVRSVVAEVAVSAAQLREGVRDALGWSRELAGELVLRTGRADAHAVSALLAAGDGVPVLLRVTLARLGAPFIRVLAIGEVTTEVVIDETGGRRAVATLRRSGRMEMPYRWEDGARVALRRALAAAAGSPTGDLAALTHDTAITEQLLGAVDRPDAGRDRAPVP